MKQQQTILNKQNGGVGYVSLISNMDVKRVNTPKLYKKLVRETLTEKEIAQTKALEWVVKMAPSYSDIMWENIYKNDSVRYIKSWILSIILFFTCVILITPVSLLDNLSPIISSVTDKLGSQSYLAQMIQANLSTLTLLILNSGIIPVFITIVGILEEHKTKSELQISKMWKHFFFLLFNTVLLQLTAQTTIKAFLTYQLD